MGMMPCIIENSCKTMLLSLNNLPQSLSNMSKSVSRGKELDVLTQKSEI